MVLKNPSKVLFSLNLKIIPGHQQNKNFANLSISLSTAANTPHFATHIVFTKTGVPWTALRVICIAPTFLVGAYALYIHYRFS